MIFVRRSDDNGNVHLLGRPFLVGDHWRHRLVRCEVNFIHRQIRFTHCAGAIPIANPC